MNRAFLSYSALFIFTIETYLIHYSNFKRRRVISDLGSLIWPKILMELIFNPCREFQGSLDGPVSQTDSPHLHVGVLGIFSDILRSVQMLKRDCGAESNGKLPHLFIPSKIVILVPEFAVEDLPSGELKPGFCACSEGPVLGQNTLLIMILQLNWCIISEILIF